MSFLAYPSLCNHYHKVSIEKTCRAFPELLLNTAKFLVTEKIDGANFQILFEKENSNVKISYGKRTAMLDDDESFYDWKNVVSKYASQIKILSDYLLHTDYQSIRVYGELFGIGINRRIRYGDDKQIRIFRVLFNDEYFGAGAGYNLFKICNIADWWVPVIQISDLSSAMDIDVENLIVTNDDNTTREIEGIVIEPIEYCRSGLVIKKKTEKFIDKSTNVLSKIHEPVSKNYQDAYALWTGYFIKNRLIDLFSKVGMIEERSDIGKYIKLFLNDVKADFLNDHCETFMSLTDKEKKNLISSSAKLSLNLLNEYL